MPKPKFPGVEHLAGIIAGPFAAVEFIAEDRMAEVMQMDADLVSAAAVQNAFDQADLIAGTQDAIFRFRGPPLPACDTHLLPVNWVTLVRFVDHARTPAQNSRHEREINLRHCSRGELAG